MGDSAAHDLGRFLYRLVRGVPWRRESDPVDGAEWLFRRVSNDHYQAGLAVPLQQMAFHPNAHDTDGISFFREMFSSKHRVAMFGRKAPYVVARLQVRDLPAGLSIVAAPENDASVPRGHCVIPELSYNRRKTPEADEFKRNLRDIAAVVYCPNRAQ